MTDAVRSRIEQSIRSNKITLFMKGMPEFPQCGFSARAVNCLDHVGARFTAIDVLADPEIREGIKEYTSWPTIPQLYIDGEFVGGSDIVQDMLRSGELEKRVRQVGAVRAD